MEIVDTLGSVIMGTLSSISPNALLVALGVFVLGLACASIGWIIRGSESTAVDADSSQFSDRKSITPALPYLNATDSNNYMEETQVIDLSDYDGTTTRSSSLLNSTLASTAESLRTLNPAHKKKQQVFEEERLSLIHI